MNFAKKIYLAAGIWGLFIMLPQYFMEETQGIKYPPAITHPEYYYGFIGVVIAWQLAFLVISRDPVRYRPLMLVTIVEKLAFGPAVVILYTLGRVSLEMLGAGIIDMIWAVLFAIAFSKTRASSTEH